MRRIVVVVCAAVLFCFGFGLLQAAEKPNETPKPAPAKTAKTKHPKKHPAKKKASTTTKDNDTKKPDAAKEAKPAAATETAKEKTTNNKNTAAVTPVAGTVGMHEPQAVSDGQLRRAQLLLAGPPSLASLKTAHKLLAEANHDYKGHRQAAADETKRAIAKFASAPKKAAAHIKRAINEIGTALSIR
jgi:cytoskeletal protein RodZ